MSAAAAVLPATPGAEWFKAPIDLNAWPAHARRAMAWFKRRTRQRRKEFVVRDLEIGREAGDMEGRPGFCRRTIQRGLKWLEDHEIIERDWSGGHGRVIKLRLPLAGDGKEKVEKPAPAPKSTPRPAPAPPPAAPQPEPAAEPTAEELAAVAEEIRRLTAQARAEDRRDADRKAADRGPVGAAGFEEAARKLTDADFARLEELERRGAGHITSAERRVLEVARRIRDP